MNEPKNILIGKVGKAVKFKNINLETDTDTGMTFYSGISRMNPTYQFYFIGPNGIHNLTDEEYDHIFPYHNVHSAWTPKCEYQDIVDYFPHNNIKIDFALILAGISASANCKNYLKKKDGNEYIPLGMFAGYAGPIIYTLNETNCPLYLISEDARHVLINATDLWNREKMCFTQIEETITTKPFATNRENKEIITKDIYCKYAEIDRMFLMGVEKNWRNNIDLDRKINSPANRHLIVISNGHGTKDLNSSKNTNNYRLPEYQKWIFEGLKGSIYEGTKVYGKWTDDMYEQYPIENRLLIDLVDEMKDARYSFIYSMIPNFVTVKPWEMILNGILPFIHPEYDQRRVLGLPEYLYVKDTEDFVNKMNELDHNTEMYVDLVNQCLSLITEEYLNGSRINNIIFADIAKDMGFTYEPSNGCEQIFDHFNRDKDILNHKILKTEELF